MNTTTEKITECINTELLQFEEEFASNFKSFSPLLSSILEYLNTTKGKRLRPILTFLTAKNFGLVTKSTMDAAIIIELLHTASLLHDDVIDKGLFRRGKDTINSLFGDKIAILVGDYLYGKALTKIDTKDDFCLMDIFSSVAVDLPKGEINESYVTTNKDFGLDIYLKVIEQKTASLISAAVKAGVRTCGNTNVDYDKMALFGYNVGMAFQIKDDILDYDTKNLSGKGIGNDIRQKRITLPLILAMDSMNDEEKEEVTRIFFSDEKEDDKVISLIERVNNTGAIEKCTILQEKYSKEALNIVHQLPLNDYSVAMSELVWFLTKRDK